jgi:hypothetical protein
MQRPGRHRHHRRLPLTRANEGCQPNLRDRCGFSLASFAFFFCRCRSYPASPPNRPEPNFPHNNPPQNWYTRPVRRSLTTLLILLFGLPLAAPLLAQGGDLASTLPACCRRSGAHHCAMTMEQAAASVQGTHLTAPLSSCPEYPKAISPSQHQTLAFSPAALHFAEAVAHPALHRQTEARARIALDGARQKRGPPAVSLS